MITAIRTPAEQQEEDRHLRAMRVQLDFHFFHEGRLFVGTHCLEYAGRDGNAYAWQCEISTAKAPLIVRLTIDGFQAVATLTIEQRELVRFTRDHIRARLPRPTGPENALQRAARTAARYVLELKAKEYSRCRKCDHPHGDGAESGRCYVHNLSNVALVRRLEGTRIREYVDKAFEPAESTRL